MTGPVHIIYCTEVGFSFKILPRDRTNTTAKRAVLQIVLARIKQELCYIYHLVGFAFDFSGFFVDSITFFISWQ